MIGASSASWSSVELHEELRDHFGSTAARTVQLCKASILLDGGRPLLINPRIRFHAWEWASMLRKPNWLIVGDVATSRDEEEAVRNRIGRAGRLSVGHVRVVRVEVGHARAARCDGG